MKNLLLICLILLDRFASLAISSTHGGYITDLAKAFEKSSHHVQSGLFEIHIPPLMTPMSLSWKVLKMKKGIKSNLTDFFNNDIFILFYLNFYISICYEIFLQYTVADVDPLIRTPTGLKYLFELVNVRIIGLC